MPPVFVTRGLVRLFSVCDINSNQNGMLLVMNVTGFVTRAL